MLELGMHGYRSLLYYSRQSNAICGSAITMVLDGEVSLKDKIQSIAFFKISVLVHVLMLPKAIAHAVVPVNFAAKSEIITLVMYLAVLMLGLPMSHALVCSVIPTIAYRVQPVATKAMYTKMYEIKYGDNPGQFHFRRIVRKWPTPIERILPKFMRMN